MVKKKKILVLGNGPSINDIEFDRLDKSIPTFGVNRIWLKYNPTWYFFHDYSILSELERDPINQSKLIANSICFSSDWINRDNRSTPHWLRKYPRRNRRLFPDSVTTGLGLLDTNILPGKTSDYIFYLAGIDLKWSDTSHFWKKMDHNALNCANKAWYDARFKKMFQNFRDMKSHGYNMISVTPDSMLNKLMRFENISNLYKK